MEHINSKFLQALTIVEKNMLHDIYSDPDLDRANVFSEEFEKSMKKLIKQRSNPWYPLINTRKKRIIIILLLLLVLFYTLSVKVKLWGGIGGIIVFLTSF